MSFEIWLTFVLVWIATGLPPGPNAVACVAAAVANGAPRAFLVPAGIGLACVIHALIVTLGLSALLLASAELWTLLRWLGAAYLAWLGIRLWRGGAGPDWTRTAPAPPLRLLRQGCLVSLSNPKAILTYLAVFPQFVDPAGAALMQLLILIPTATVIVLAIYCGWVVLASPLRRWLTTPRRHRIFKRAAGTAFLCSACGLAFGARR